MDRMFLAKGFRIYVFMGLACLCLVHGYAKLGETMNCANDDCSETLSEGKAKLAYQPRDSKFLKLKKGDVVSVKGKKAGAQTDLWAGQVMGSEQFGFFPKAFIKEYVLMHSNPSVVVNIKDFLAKDEELEEVPSLSTEHQKIVIKHKKEETSEESQENTDSDLVERSIEQQPDNVKTESELAENIEVNDGNDNQLDSDAAQLEGLPDLDQSKIIEGDKNQKSDRNDDKPASDATQLESSPVQLDQSKSIDGDKYQKSERNDVQENGRQPSDILTDKSRTPSPALSVKKQKIEDCVDSLIEIIKSLIEVPQLEEEDSLSLFLRFIHSEVKQLPKKQQREFENMRLARAVNQHH